MKPTSLFVLVLSAAGQLTHALYFTAPTAGTNWALGAGQPITWITRGGDPLVATLVIRSAEGGQATLAEGIALASGGTTFPAGVGINSASANYSLVFVDSANTASTEFTSGWFSIAAISDSSAAGGVVPNPKATTTSLETLPATPTIISASGSVQAAGNGAVTVEPSTTATTIFDYSPSASPVAATTTSTSFSSSSSSSSSATLSLLPTTTTSSTSTSISADATVVVTVTSSSSSSTSSPSTATLISLASSAATSGVTRSAAGKLALGGAGGVAVALGAMVMGAGWVL